MPYRLLPACLTKNHNRVPQEEPSAASKIMMRTMCRLPTIPLQRKGSSVTYLLFLSLSSPPLSLLYIRHTVKRAHLCSPVCTCLPASAEWISLARSKPRREIADNPISFLFLFIRPFVRLCSMFCSIGLQRWRELWFACKSRDVYFEYILGLATK